MNRRLFLNASIPAGIGLVAASSLTAGENKLKTVAANAINPLDFGAKGDGITDDTEAIQKALDSMVDGSALVLPVGNFVVTKPLVVNQKQHVTISGLGAGSRLMAAAPMEFLFLARYPFSSSRIDSITFDANSMAETALRVEGGNYVKLNNLLVYSPRNMGIHCGPVEPETKCGPELLISNSRIIGMQQPTSEHPYSKIGILVEKAWTDSHYDNIIINGFVDCAMELRANSNLISKVHVYRAPAYQYKKGMCLKGNENYLVQAYFDNAIDVGCEILGNNTTIFSSYILRIKLAFNNGPVSPGVGIQIGNKDKKVRNVTIMNTSFVNHVPDTPEFAANKLMAIELLNGENIVCYENQYERAEPGETRTTGKATVLSGNQLAIVYHQSLVKPQNIQLTPRGRVFGNFWVSEVDESSFKINLTEKQEVDCSFDFITRE